MKFSGYCTVCRRRLTTEVSFYTQGSTTHDAVECPACGYLGVITYTETALKKMQKESK